MVAMPSRPFRERVLGTALFKAELHHIPSQKWFAPVAHFAFSPTNCTWTYVYCLPILKGMPTVDNSETAIASDFIHKIWFLPDILARTRGLKPAGLPRAV